MSSKKGKKQAKNQSRPKIKHTMPNKPPAFDGKIFFKHKFRYICSVVGVCELTGNDFFALLAIVNAATPTALSAFTAVKLRKIQIWGTGAGTGPTTISIEPENIGITNMGTKPILLADTSYSINTFAKLTYVPNSMSAQAQWQDVVATNATSGQNMRINISANIGDVMDITVDCALNTLIDTNDEFRYNIQSAPVTTVIGALVAMALPTSGTVKWLPNQIPQ